MKRPVRMSSNRPVRGSVPSPVRTEFDSVRLIEGEVVESNSAATLTQIEASFATVPAHVIFLYPLPAYLCNSTYMSGQFLAYFIVCMPGLLAIAGACSSDIPKLLGYSETTLLFEWPFKCPVVMGCKIGIGLLGVGFSCWAFYRQQYRPFKDFEELRSVTFKRTFEDQIKKFRRERASKDLRLNIMRARYWCKIGNWVQFGRLVPIYHYDGEDRRVDRMFCFKFLRLFKYRWAQGISGRAFLTREATAEPLDASSINDYNLTEEMKRHTNDLTAIVSVPIVKRRGKRKYRYVGVMNVDSSTAEFAQAIRDKEYALTMAGYLNDSAMYVSMWL